MLDSSYLSLVQDKTISKYTGIYSKPFNDISDISSLLAKTKSDTSTSDYNQKIVEIAEADAQTDIKNGNSKSRQKSDAYLDLRDEYVSSSSDSSSYSSLYSGSVSTLLNSTMQLFNTGSTDNYLTNMNKIFANAMNEVVRQQTRGVQFDFKYNQAYNAYKASSNASSAASTTTTSSVDVLA